MIIIGALNWMAKIYGKFARISASKFVKGNSLHFYSGERVRDILGSKLRKTGHSSRLGKRHGWFCILVVVFATCYSTYMAIGIQGCHFYHNIMLL